ncbi:hypothetical protein [Pedobacter sandarakinus]|uniref:hypothetical protein n=1 Tax=Pedobacter sandarakinus TaxID=353156 RepID=UPI002246F8EC|nr:hypothetical protein [Pedobacter sandarakinus]MCX2575367.1 hypothetical protein [Pedobacter sandarakinus]
MTKYLLFITFIFPIYLFGRNGITKTLLKKIIKESKLEIKNGKFSLPSSRPWQFDNTDSSCFKKDTLTTYSYNTSKQKDLCKVVDWTFYHENASIFGNESNCKEPPIRSVEKYLSEYFTIAIYNVENELMIDLLGIEDRMIWESFIVIEIENNKDYSKIMIG